MYGGPLGTFLYILAYKANPLSDPIGNTKGEAPLLGLSLDPKMRFSVGLALALSADPCTPAR